MIHSFIHSNTSGAPRFAAARPVNSCEIVLMKSLHEPERRRPRRLGAVVGAKPVRTPALRPFKVQTRGLQFVEALPALMGSRLLALSLALPGATIGAETNATATNSVAVSASNREAPQKPTIAVSGKVDFDSFKIINDRNIFNGNRSGQRITSTRSSSQPRSVRVDSFSLVGTLLADKGSTAFFDGTESGFRKALRVGDRIAGFEIQQVHYAGVRLLDGTNTLDLRVGSGLRREDTGPWKSSSGGTTYAATGSSRSSDSYSSRSSSSYSSRSNGSDSRDRNSYSRSESAPASSSSSESAHDPNADEILRKLMEKRAKE